MQKAAVLSALLVGTSYAQQGVVVQDLSSLDWTEGSPDGTKDADGNIVQQSSPESITSDIQTSDEKTAEQGEITEYRKKYDGIYDPNMFPYGPLEFDARITNTDDAVSGPINLPSPFPLFNNQQASVIRAQSNGLIILSDSTVLDSEPQAFRDNDISAPFVAAFWNDIWSKKHGRMYMRTEVSNTTLLSEMRQSIIDGMPEFNNGGLGELKYAFVFSMWRVTFYGAVKSPDQLQNTFQICLVTDGTHSFMINNYQEIGWTIANGATNHAAAGYSINGYNSGDLISGSFDGGASGWSTASTNSNVGGRHILRLDDNAIEYTESTEAPPTQTTADASTTPPVDTNVFTAVWPSNDNTLGGAMGHYRPADSIANGTCSIEFPTTVAWFHVFDAHIRADAPSTPTSWNIVAANPTFEPGTDGTFSYIVFFERGNEFGMDEVEWNCDSGDEYTYAVYSFPQNYEQTDTRSNVRVKGNSFDANVVLSFASQVANFTVDDGRIAANSIDNMNFVLSDIPDSLEEIWFQFTYTGYFGSNEVGVTGQN